MKQFDLRSDTITKPTQGMREAMYRAEVGDDVYREDPTVNRLEAMAAQLTGKERALFVTSGSMGNLIALYINCGRGNEVLAAQDAHIIQHEIGAPAAIAGVLPIGIAAPRGILSAQLLADKVKPQAYDLAATTMVEVENTIGGCCYPVENLIGIREFATVHGLKVHMDGARVFNAQIATGVSISEYASYADTITFCLSKGLGAPVGSLLCGNEAFYRQALKVRKMLGGGMRQSGILAAAGIYALEHHVNRLADDHLHAQEIARTINAAGWAEIDMDGVQTNIMFFSVEGMDGSTVVRQLEQVGVLANAEGDNVRLVTNLSLDDEDTRQLCRILAKFEPKKQ
ncbi:MAG: low-specificity L-threonine aldolase [Sphaerochaetaceae bacterium]|jgi:threonine aldolase